MALKIIDVVDFWDNLQLRIAQKEARVMFWEKNHRAPSKNEEQIELLNSRFGSRIYYNQLFRMKA